MNATIAMAMAVFALVAAAQPPLPVSRAPFDRWLFGGYGRDGAYEPPRGEVSIWVDGCADRAALRRLAGHGKACEGI